MKIFKYIIDKAKIDAPQKLTLPFNRRFLHLDFYQDQITVWFLVNEDASTIQEPLTYIVKYTGDSVSPNELHSKTVIDHAAGLVYHIFIQEYNLTREQL